MKSLFLSENKLIVKEIIIIMVKIDKKKSDWFNKNIEKNWHF
jgi:hypothetical protein